ncbi:hypothetical protein MKY15_20570 [Sporosarcina sp. FSL K6-1540]|uniref:hypothetical protein n=1 Tax=Sporosarcina sp. FSL K6-1540 TaxID=2921555 RepID=UPI00315A4DFF
MAEHSKFFDSLNPLDPDKVYTADEFIDYFEKLITTGIMKSEANMLKVETSGSNMNTTVDTGAAYLNGRLYENDAKLSLTHEVEALGKSRIDRVVVRLVLSVDARYIKAFVKKGVAGVSPIAPPLERTGDIYEISLAQVKVIGGQTYINVADVVDERGKVDICPWAGSKILPNFNDAALAELVAKVENLTANTSWKTTTLLNGWAGTFEYRKNAVGILELSFIANATNTHPTTLIATLPADYRPRRTTVFPVIHAGNGSMVGAQIFIQSNGEVRFAGGSVISAGINYGFNVTIPSQ